MTGVAHAAAQRGTSVGTAPNGLAHRVQAGDQTAIRLSADRTPAVPRHRSDVRALSALRSQQYARFLPSPSFRVKHLGQGYLPCLVKPWNLLGLQRIATSHTPRMAWHQRLRISAPAAEFVPS